MGQAVENLKAILDSQYDIPYSTIVCSCTISMCFLTGPQKLFLNDQIMPDPLSLSDFPAIKPGVDVVIKVVIEEDAEDDDA